MWCVVKADQVTQIVHKAKAVRIDDVNHPATIFTSWSASELKDIGVYPYSETRVDERFYEYSDFQYTIGSDAVTGAWKTKTAKSMDDVTKDEVIYPGLKSIWITSTKDTAKSLLAQTDWYVTRLAEKTTAISSKVSTYRDKVRAACDKIETAIKACSDVAALEAMFVVPVDSDGKATGKAPMHDWPDDE